MVWAEKTVPSGIAALLVATVPLWIVILEALRPQGERPTPTTLLGVAIGLVGMVVLVGPGNLSGGVDPKGAVALTLASFCWAAGSQYARRAPVPTSPLVATAIQMIMGGALLTVVGLGLGEGQTVSRESFSGRSTLALIYLIVFGSIIAYTAYTWLLRNISPAKVSTYAYVNPVIALFLGWIGGGETLTARLALAATIIVAAVMLITRPSQVLKAVSARAEEKTLPCPPPLPTTKAAPGHQVP